MRVACPAPVAGSHSRTVPSSPAEASCRPSGLNATANTRPSWPVRVACPAPVAGSHSRTVPSPPAEASCRPSGLNATACTRPWWPVRVACPAPVAGSHSRTVPSSPAEASCRPSGLNATAYTAPSWPVRVACPAPVAGSHSRTVPSPPAEASCRPSGLNATAYTAPVVAGEGGLLGAGGRIPQPHRPVLAGGGELPPVRAERHRVHRAVVAGEGGLLGAGGRIPQPHRPVLAGGGELPPVRAERHRAHTRPSWPVRVACPAPVAGSHSRTVPSSLAEASRRAVRAERHRVHRAVVAGEEWPAGAGGRIPQPHRPVLAGGGELPPVRAERHREAPGSSWPVRVACPAPVAGSHSRTVPSSPAEASCRPSGLNATALTRPVWPVRTRCNAGVSAGRPHRGARYSEGSSGSSRWRSIPAGGLASHPARVTATSAGSASPANTWACWASQRRSQPIRGSSGSTADASARSVSAACGPASAIRLARYARSVTVLAAPARSPAPCRWCSR